MSYLRWLLVMAVGLQVPGAAVARQKQAELTAEEITVAQRARHLYDEGQRLSQIGKPTEGLPKLMESLALYRQVYAAGKYPNGHSNLATCLLGIGSTLHDMGQLHQALPYMEQALAMNQRLVANDDLDSFRRLAVTLSDLASLRLEMGAVERALAHYDEALAAYRKGYPADRYPDGHPHLAQTLANMAAALRSMGALEKARDLSEQAVAMRLKAYPAEKFPDGHFDLV